ncbi:putative dehydrogenase [Natranaerovirga hydrolytica]|uniref:Putative dehydrogenase n=1 Tax=Natranaerovirga hydrolytica TaxID=680378 RepID=A0A4V2Q1R6_9FIRM|nr:Gfo/Idh/MocA family oxidoreductase [Natranaerovirga hydrolytica]TCK98601.1 putative dehydrogenase [Natranaerovirga hydrolytica]
MRDIKIGLIGLGIIGQSYCQHLNENKIKNAKIAAVTCRSEEKANWVKEHLSGVTIYETGEALIQSNAIDAVIISTPHQSHPYFAKLAFAKNLHVLIEKPSGTDIVEVFQMNELAKKTQKKFGIMFDKRLEPIYIELKKILEKQLIGKINRLNWTIGMYRSQGYYDSNEWRGTIKGEGGGVLLNQAQHQLDIMQWLFGMPEKVMGHCKIGKYHTIEVEDEFTGLMEFEDDLTGVFIASTGEKIESNRLEVVGEKGKIIAENYHIKILTTDKDIEHTVNINETQFEENQMRKVEMIQNWINGIVFEEDSMVKGEEGILALIITQGFYQSFEKKQWIQLKDLFPYQS